VWLTGNMPLQGAIPRQADKGASDHIDQGECTPSRHVVAPRENENEHVVAKWKLLDGVGQGGNRGNPNVSRPGPQGGSVPPGRD
jgi:hypothetical protein